VAGAEGRGLLRLRVPPVARRRRRRGAPAGGVGEDHLPILAQAAGAKGVSNAVLYQAEQEELYILLLPWLHKFTYG
jgi:hypothetical protein